MREILFLLNNILTQVQFLERIAINYFKMEDSKISEIAWLRTASERKKGIFLSSTFGTFERASY